MKKLPYIKPLTETVSVEACDLMAATAAINVNTGSDDDDWVDQDEFA